MIGLFRLAFLIAVLFWSASVLADGHRSDPDHVAKSALQERLDSLQAQRDDVPGFAIAVIEDRRMSAAATGIAAPDGRAMTARTPFRLASVTKTFVAAAILRLSEQGAIDLDAPIEGMVSPLTAQLLGGDGYDLSVITSRHLLMHSAGLDDHFGSDAGIAIAFDDPIRVWTRGEQVALMVSLTDPVGAPGERFHYSDTGYVVLGEIVERVTGKPLAQAVRELSKFDALGIANLRWETWDGPEQGAERAHQWINGSDIFAWHGSLDGLGGGGLIGDVVDTARYYEALFTGRVFDTPETLEEMRAAPGHPEGSPYRLGLFTMNMGPNDVFMHGGFWGVHALHVPDLELTVVAVALDEAGYRDIRQLAFDLISERQGSAAPE